MQKINISQGITLDNFFPGLVIISLSVFALQFDLILAIALMLFGFIILLSIKGTLIDTNHRKIKPYLDFFLFKIGSWKSLENFHKITLTLTNEAQTMNSRGSSTTIKTKSVDIHVVGQNAKVHLKEFTDYKEAKKFLQEYSVLLQLENIDTSGI